MSNQPPTDPLIPPQQQWDLQVRILKPLARTHQPQSSCSLQLQQPCRKFHEEIGNLLEHLWTNKTSNLKSRCKLLEPTIATQISTSIYIQSYINVPRCAILYFCRPKDVFHYSFMCFKPTCLYTLECEHWCQKRWFEKCQFLWNMTIWDINWVPLGSST